MPRSHEPSSALDSSPTPAATSALPLIVLTPEELANAPHEVLVSLVERQQIELVRITGRAEHIEEELGEEKAERKRLEREVEGARGRVDELLADQGRMEEELGGRIEVLDKLRATIRDLDREKREATRRYREQSETFESERQAWYDQEQHYKLRISNLASGNKRSGRPAGRKSAPADMRIDEDVAESAEGDELPETPRADAPPSRSSTSSPEPSSSSTRSNTPSTSATSDSPTGPSATELSLRAQLDTLSTAHSSLTSTLHKLQTEMSDLKRVYQDVQEQNESYEILLGEKTLSGEVRSTALFRQSFSWGESGLGDEAGGAAYGSAFGFAGGLEAVGEEGELPFSSDEELSIDGEDDDEYDPAKDSDDIERVLLESRGTGSPNSGAVAAEKAARRRSRRASSLVHGRGGKSGASGAPRGGTLDLATELEAATQLDELDEEEVERMRGKEERRQKRRDGKKKTKAAAAALRREGSFSGATEGELQGEIRHLREANKALTLYVSKIVDRVCSQEGFEKVLAVDYRTTPKTDVPGSPPSSGPPLPDKKPRPASIGFFRTTAAATPAPAPTPSRRVDPSTPMSAASFVTAPVATPTPASNPSASTGPRKSGGFGWESVTSVFSLGRATPSPSSTPSHGAGMKPLVLADSARKVELGDEMEDEEDRKERARIRAEMVQLGFDPPPPSRLAAPGGASGSPSPVRSPGESSLREQERARALEALEKQDAARGNVLTELPQRRMSLLGQRRASARTNGELGLGIMEATGGAHAVESKPAQEDPVAAEGGARKALRRLSRGWGSPPLG